MSEPAKHLKFGGSTAHRWLRCAGSASLIATLPPQPENEYMAEGTRAHALLALALEERRDDVTDMDGLALQPNWPPYTTDDVEAVQHALDFVNDILAKEPAATLWVERMVTLREDVGGTVDVAIYLPSTKTLWGLDYKHGRGKWVSADNNPQLMFYLTCLMAGCPELEITNLKATIMQPRCPAGEPIRTGVYGVADIIAFWDDVDAAVAAATAPQAAFAPGDEQCHWCPAAHICPALHGEVASASVNAVLNVYPDVSDITLRLPSAERMRHNIVALAETLDAIPLLQSWVDAVQEQALALAKDGHAVPGYKLIATQPRRYWIDEVHPFEWFKGLIPLNDFAPRKLLSVAQAETLVKKINKALVKEMAQFVNKRSSGVKLVPESVKGDAINPVQQLAAASLPPTDI